MTWIITYFSFSDEEMKAEKGDRKWSRSSRWLAAEPGLGLIFLETQVPSLSISPPALLPTHPLIHLIHPSIHRPCILSLTIMQKAFPFKQTELFQWKTLTLRLRVTLKHLLVSRASWIISLGTYSIAKEASEILPVTIVSSNVISCEFRAFLQQGKILITTSNIL